MATLAAGLGTGALFIMEPPHEARWTGGVLFDDAVRRNVRLDSAAARKRARSLGDLPYYAAPMLPLIIDPLIVSWWVRGDTKAALNVGMVGLEAFSYSGLLSFISTRSSLRERPDSAECRRTHPEGGCEVDTESFWSGHTSIAATSAGLVCANHRYLPLYGAAWADAGACILSTSGAVASGVSRLLADRHYTTDVLAGFGVGFAVGYSVPVLLHYAKRQPTQLSLSIEPGSPCVGACVKLSGTF